jgi:hypothetical protein
MLKYYKQEFSSEGLGQTAQGIVSSMIIMPAADSFLVAGYINIAQDTELLQQTELSFLLVTPRRTYSIYSDSAADARGWLDILEKAIARAKGLA